LLKWPFVHAKGSLSVKRLVCVSNRISVPGNGSGAGGLAVGLTAAMSHTGGVWFGWSGETSETPSDTPQVVTHGNIEYATIDLTPAQVEDYYNGYCNGTLWPLFHYFPDKFKTAPVTYGGYSESVVVDENFVLRVPENLDLAGTAPLLCAGITTYSPMKHWNVGPGKKVGVVGLGGLGHMGVKFAHALGAEVVVFTTSPGKKEDALRLGADEVVISKNADEMQKHVGSFDFILDAVSANHDINAYLHLLRRDGNLTLVGAPEKPLEIAAFNLIMGRRSISGSPIGGIKETQEMLDFCGEHNITADVEVIPIQKVNEAYERLLKSDVKYRFSIDMESLKSE